MIHRHMQILIKSVKKDCFLMKLLTTYELLTATANLYCYHRDVARFKVDCEPMRIETAKLANICSERSDSLQSQRWQRNLKLAYICNELNSSLCERRGTQFGVVRNDICTRKMHEMCQGSTIVILKCMGPTNASLR